MTTHTAAFRSNLVKALYAFAALFGGRARRIAERAAPPPAPAAHPAGHGRAHSQQSEQSQQSRPSQQSPEPRPRPAAPPSVRVAQLMTRQVRFCHSHDTLHHAARIMWEHDCGCVPVVDGDGRVRAMITDRDICMAALTQGRRLAEIDVSSAASQHLFAVSEEDLVERALALMSQHRVRRLAVTDSEGRLAGVLSLGDIARNDASAALATPEVSMRTARVLAAICEPGPPPAVTP